MAFTAADVKKLREMTNVGMMDCKKALAESDGNIDKAIEYLREKGLAKAAKKADRIAAEGMAYADVIDGKGVIVEVNAETDFASKAPMFVEFVKDIAAAVAASDAADVEALKNVKYPGSEMTVGEMIPEKVMVIGENIQVRRFARFTENTSVAYVHAGGRIGVLVNLAVEGGIDATEIGKDVAMQIAALNPRFWDKSLVTADVLDEEKKILVAQMDNDPKMASKPQQVKEKIAAGKINKFYEENCLLQQAFVKDGGMSVEEYIASAAKALGGSVKFVDAIRFEKGEGIEKRVDDFAAEVAAQAGL
ncbi:MAG: elongation factor Ts [Oscillospiraceae bacterium]|nr:elongation factor Ts [Oscillospiraceae bacterium]